MLLIALLAPAVAMPAEESSIFGWTDLWGDARIRYNFNDQQRESDGTTQARWQQQLALGAEGYVYHPALLNMRFEGGPLLVQQRNETDAGLATSNDVLWGGGGVLDILQIKPYGVSIRFQRSHPSVTTSLSGDYLTENTTLGITGRLEQVIIPASINWGISQNNSLGSGQGDIRDEKVKEAFLNASMNWRQRDSFRLKADSIERVSGSGSAGLPIRSSTRNHLNVILDAKNYLSWTRRANTLLDQTLAIYRERSLESAGAQTNRKRYRAQLARNAGAGTRLSGHFQYLGYDSRDVGSDLVDYGVQYGGRSGRDVRYVGSLKAERERGTQINRDRRGGEGSVSVQKDSPLGKVSATLTVRGDRTDQESISQWVQVYDEPFTLEGTTPVALANPFVDPFSVTVTNTPGSQVFSEGLDYRLIVSGDVTSIQRLVDGNILDGQAVRASYQYRAAGTLAYDSRGGNLGVALAVSRNAQFYASFSTVDNILISGSPDVPLRDTDRTEVGTNLQFRLTRWALAGADASYVIHEESINPYVGERFSGRLEMDLPWALKLNLSAGLDRRDLENSAEDVNARWQSVAIGGQIGSGGRLSYQVFSSSDDGGSQPRDSLRQKLNYRWGFRQLNFDLSFSHENETLDGTGRESTRLLAQLWRSF